MKLARFIFPVVLFFLFFVFPHTVKAGVITWAEIVPGTCPHLLSGPDICAADLYAMTDDSSTITVFNVTYGVDFRTGASPGVNTYLFPASPSQTGNLSIGPSAQRLGTFQTQANNGTGLCALNEGQVLARARFDTSDPIAQPVSINAESTQNITNIGAMVHITVLKADGTPGVGAIVTVSPADGSPGTFTADSFGLVQGIHNLNCTIGHTVTATLGGESGSIFLPAQTGSDPNTICNGDARSFTVRISGGVASPPPTPTPTPVTTPTPGPQPEICDGIDNDLDGFIDEGCPMGVFLFANGVRPTLTIPSAGTVTLSWTTNGAPSFCVQSANWGGGIVSGGGGSQSGVSVSSNTTFSITCQKPGSPDVSDSVTVNINPVVIATPTPSPGPVPNEICDNGIDDDLDGKIDTADPDCPTVSGFLTIWQACLSGNPNPELTIQYVPYAPPNIYDTAIILYKRDGGGNWVWQIGWDDSPSPFNSTFITYPGDYRVLAYQATIGGTFVDNAYFAAVDCSTVIPSPTPSPLPTPTPGPPTEVCDNGIDDDGDGLIDEGCPLPPAPPQAGVNTTVQFCKAYGDIVAIVNYFSFGGVVPPGGLNFMDIFEGSPFGSPKANIDPWPASSVKVSGPGFFTSGITYYFRGYYLGAGGFPNLIDAAPGYTITPNFATMPVCPGIPVAAVPVDLEIIAAGMTDPVTGLPKTDFLPGEPARATFTVRNPAATPVFTSVGFWPTGSISNNGSGALPSCPGSAGIPATGAGVDPITQSFPSGDTNVSFNFTVPGTISTYFAHAYVSYACIPDEGPVTGSIPWGNNDVAITYVVGSADPWLETLAGDVGSTSALSVGGAAPAGRYTSSYLLAQNSNDVNAKSQRWALKNYNLPQSSSSVYDYLEGRFLTEAKGGNSTCLQSALVGISTGFNYCSGNVTLNAGSSPAGNVVWFIDGNLTLAGNFDVASPSTIVFIVRGDIIVNSNLSEADGMYISGGTFRDTSGPTAGPQLITNGAIYADNVVLDRDCDTSCDSLVDPVEVITFEPRYIGVFNGLLGVPSITWQEVAP